MKDVTKILMINSRKFCVIIMIGLITIMIILKMMALFQMESATAAVNGRSLKSQFIPNFIFVWGTQFNNIFSLLLRTPERERFKISFYFHDFPIFVKNENIYRIEDEKIMQGDLPFIVKDNDKIFFPAEHQAQSFREDIFTDFLFLRDRFVFCFIYYHKTNLQISSPM